LSHFDFVLFFFFLNSSLFTGSNDMACTADLRPSLINQSESDLMIQEVSCDDESEYDEDKAFEEINRELCQFEEKPKPNLNDTEAVNLGDADNVRETKISIHIEPNVREELIKTLVEFKDVFAWSYDDMPGLRTKLVVHKLPTDPAYPPVKQKLRKFKTEMSVKIKEEVIKQLQAKVIRVTRYPEWLANVDFTQFFWSCLFLFTFYIPICNDGDGVPVPKKDGKIKVCVDTATSTKQVPRTIFHCPTSIS